MRPRPALLRRSGTALGASSAVALALALSAPGAAIAAPAGTPNSCRYTFDNKFRDLPSSVDATAAIQPDDRHPSPTSVDPGMTVTTPGGTIDVSLPDDLAKVGFAVDLLDAGPNTIDVQGWFALEGTNTAEGVRRYEQFTLTASTFIEAEPGPDGAFISSTPWSYAKPAFPAYSWTATGGDVELRQAGPGAFTTLPVGPGGASRQIAGSLVLRLDPAGLGGANVYLDCQPATTDLDPAQLPDRSGPTFTPVDATPFATFAGPRNQICLNELGRQLANQAAGWPATPAGLTRELDPTKLVIAAPAAPATFDVGKPLSLSGARLQGELSADTVTMFGRYDDGGDALITTGTAYPLRGAVTIEASNTAEGRQTVPLPAGATWTPTATGTGATSTWNAAAIDLALADTTWTPTGTGPVRFRATTPGTAPAVTLTGQPGGPGGANEAGTYQRLPYGSTVLQLGTDANGIALDCAQAAVTLVPSPPAWSDAGRPATGTGRYAYASAAGGPPVFATVVDARTPPRVDPPTPPAGDGDPPPLPGGSGTLPTPPGPPVPVPNPPKQTAKVASVRITSTSLKRSRGAVSVKLGNLVPARTTGKLSIVTKQKLRVGKAKAKRITIGSGAKVSLAGGRSGSVRVKLSSAATKLLRTRRSVSVTVTFTPTRSGTQKPVTRTVTLRR